jgi:hypothetical protein
LFHRLASSRESSFGKEEKKKNLTHLFGDVVFRDWDVKLCRFPLRRAFNRHRVPFREHFDG